MSISIFPCAIMIAQCIERQWNIQTDYWEEVYETSQKRDRLMIYFLSSQQSCKDFLLTYFFPLKVGTRIRWIQKDAGDGEGWDKKIPQQWFFNLKSIVYLIATCTLSLGSIEQLPWHQNLTKLATMSETWDQKWVKWTRIVFCMCRTGGKTRPASLSNPP